jgi:hypothetical protein
MEYAVEKGSGAIIYIPSFIKNLFQAYTDTSTPPYVFVA